MDCDQVNLQWIEKWKICLVFIEMVLKFRNLHETNMNYMNSSNLEKL